MKVEDSIYINLEHYKCILPFGIFYFFDDFIISEIDEGIHFDWGKGKQIIKIAERYYGGNSNVVYISNRINSYSLSPMDWLKFNKKYKMHEFIIVSKSKIGITNIFLEKIFSKINIKSFNDIDDAIFWMLHFKRNNSNFINKNWQSINLLNSSSFRLGRN